MGGWKLEAGRYMILVGFPVAAFWGFNQPGVFEYFMKGYKLPESKEADAQVRQMKEDMAADKRKRDYEKFLREQMKFEEARRIREQNRI